MKRLSVVPTLPCDRRQLLLQLGLGVLLVGCGGSGSGDDDPLAPDAGDGPPTDAGTTEVVLDLALEENAALRTVGGSRVVTQPRRVIVIRTGDAELIALSAACTHQGTTLRYRPDQMDLHCSNHGSEFALDGSVERGPALRALALFVTRYDAAAQTVTIAIPA